MTKDEALKLALEALELHGKQYPHMVKGYCLDAITAIKEALAQPEQPKVRTGNCLRVGVCASEGHKIAPQRTGIPLTDEDKKEWIEAMPWPPEPRHIMILIEGIEFELKEKNT